MKLERMTLGELSKFCDDLHELHAAGEILETAGLTPEFDLSSRGTLIRVPALFAAGDPGPVVIEPAPGVVIESAPGPSWPIEPNWAWVRADPEPIPGTPFVALRQPIVRAEVAPAPAAPVPAAAPPVSPPPADDSGKRDIWTDSDDDTLMRMKGESRTMKDIAASLKRTIPAVDARYRALTKAGKAPPAQRRATLAADGVLRGPWTQDDIATLCQMRGDGAGWPEIGAALNRTPKSCQMYFFNNFGQTSGQQSESDAGPEVAPAAPVETGPAAVAPAVPPAPEPAGAAGSAAPAPEPAPAPVPELAPAAPVVVQHIRRAAPPVVVPGDLTGEAKRLFVAMAEAPRAARWGVGDDLALVEGLVKGGKLAEVAMDLGFDAADAKARFQALVAPVADDRGRLTLDGQKHLLTALRALAAARGVAA